MYSMAIVFQQDDATVSAFGEAWLESPLPYPDPVYINVATEPNQEALAVFLNDAKIDVYPTIVFYKEAGGNQEIVTRMEGPQSKAAILQKMQQVSGGVYDNWTDGQTPGGEGYFNLQSLFAGPKALIWIAVIVYALTRK